ncbi:MAG: hypothetical protein JW720_14190 [Sedimentisphaerales bacterium]|nr:hypothetical protein [Sedimentisphaerales bacterium]
MKRDWFYIWVLPLLWCGFTVVSYFHPGDEHALFVLGSIAGTWISFFVGFRGPASLLTVIAAGMVVLALGGLLLDLLRIRKRWWFSLFAALAVLLFIQQYFEYGSIKRMANKNRYVTAVVAAVCNWSMYLAVILLIISGSIKVLVARLKHKTTVQG